MNVAQSSVSAPASAAAPWFEPEWPAPASVRALFTTRHGGVSAAPWDALNLGAHVGDRPEHVAQNRALLQAAVHERGGGELLFLNQVHGCDVLDLDSQAPGESLSGRAADGSITGQPGQALVMMVADCLPVLITDRAGQRVGAFHAGWRGLAGEQGRGILESAVEAFVRARPQAPVLAASELLVWLGPCIGPSAFEVGEEVRQAFARVQPEALTLFQPVAQRPGHWLADLAGLARLRLRAAGVSAVYGNDGTTAWCTHTQSASFFSHRRDGHRLGGTGRMAACIWRV
ncbi:peptidoglycan editing factor PgeF [Curvibacter lanceolatus]|uniref:peptidoglycan editing factor PgeF n=1 Tax=Curvibacter lanceolatus TaxID=86182 RepID=UPI003B59EB42